MNRLLELDYAARPRFVDNQDGNTLARAVNTHVAAIRKLDETPEELCIASTFFNLGGFELCAEALEAIGSVRLLLGTEPLPEARRPLDQDEREAMHEALVGLDAGLKRHRDLLPFDRETDRTVRRLLAFLRREGVRVRRLEDAFLHAKAFHLRSESGALIVGSSNLTRGGMQTNLELNLGHQDGHVIERVGQWFDDLWDRAEDFDLAAYYEPLMAEYPPYLIFLRVLYELYGQEIEEEVMEEGIPLLTFQKHGVWRAMRLLERHHGVLVADGVGLGKTFTAGEIMYQYIQRRQRVLLLAPAALRDSTWKKFLTKHQLFVECLSFEELARDRQLGGELEKLQRPLAEYALAVIDEAHNYRNPSAPTRAGVLRRLLQGQRRDLVLLTATPVNNSLWDLYHLLSFFIKQDAALAHQGVFSIRGRFDQAMQEDPFDLNPDLLFPVIDAVTVKRTRQFIRRYYQNDLITDNEGNLIPITFPQPVARSVDYDFEELLPEYLARLEEVLAPAEGWPRLRLARYQPEKYPDDGEMEPHDTALVGLIRSGLLKRFESSVHAFRTSLGRMIQEHRRFLEALERGIVANKELLQEISAADDEVELDQLMADHPGGQPANQFNVTALKRDVLSDMQILEELRAPLEPITADQDPKLARLKEVLEAIARAAEEEGGDPETIRTRRKVLVFSYFEDTIDWAREYLRDLIENQNGLDAYQGRIASVAGDESSTGEGRERVVAAFAPESMENPNRQDDRYDLLLSTDVLAEGVNLQQCRNIINLDMPWNPMRLVQRHGRVDRINSRHPRVFLYTFFPDRQLDALLNLEHRVRRKLAQAAASVGVEQAPLADMEGTEQYFTETREEIERLHEEDAELFERGCTQSAAQTGEEYREQLRRALNEQREAITEMPWKAGSGLVKGRESGHAFCARVRDRVFLRFVRLNDTKEEQGIETELGACLRYFECESEAERVVPVELAETAYDAWQRARRSIHDEWMFQTDPANLQPRLRPISRMIVEQLTAQPPPDVSEQRLRKWIEAAETPIPLREERALKEVLNDPDLQGNEKSRCLGEKIEELGLEPQAAPDPLPPVAIREVHLVCWMAVSAVGTDHA